MNKKQLAITLRKQGYTYSVIAKKTGLSKSTLSYHLSEIPFTPNEVTKKRLQKARAAAIKSKAKKKLDSIQQSRQQAIRELGKLSDRDLFMAGIGLYIGEGSKTQDMTRLVNSDHRVVCLFIRWLKLLGLRNRNIFLRVHGYPDTDFNQAESFWLSTTGLPATQLQPACVDTRIAKDKRRKGIHEYGTAHVTVHARGRKEFGVFLSRKIKAYMDAVFVESE